LFEIEDDGDWDKEENMNIISEMSEWIVETLSIGLFF
jgi:hypothetical protein